MVYASIHRVRVSGGPYGKSGVSAIYRILDCAMIRIYQQGLRGWSVVEVEVEINEANCCKCSVHSHMGPCFDKPVALQKPVLFYSRSTTGHLVHLAQGSYLQRQAELPWHPFPHPNSRIITS